jgi:hypothetical protein
MDLNNLIPWLPFIGSIVVVVLGYLLGKRKQSSDIVNETSNAVLNLIKPLNERIDGQNCRIKTLEEIVESQNKELELLRPLPQIVTAMTRGIHILISQIRKHGFEPEWTPENLEPVIVKLETELQKRIRLDKDEAAE